MSNEITVEVEEGTKIEADVGGGDDVTADVVQASQTSIDLQKPAAIKALVEKAGGITTNIKGVIDSYLSLADTPSSFSGNASKAVKVKSSEDGLEFGNISHTNLTAINSDDHHTKYTDEEAQDATNDLLVGGNNITLTYDDPNNNLTIDASSTDTRTDVSDSGSLIVSEVSDINFGSNLDVTDDNDGTVTVDGQAGYSDEDAQDAVGTIMTGSGATTVTYDDAADTITVTSTDNDTQTDVSDDGTQTVSSVGDINFRNNIDVTDDTDGTVTVDGSDTQLSKEDVQDDAWDVLTGSQTLISVSYQDASDEVDFTVNDDLSQYDNSTSGFISDITAEPIGDLSNVSISNPSNGDGLIYKNGSWENQDVTTQTELNTHINTSDAHHSRPSAGSYITENNNNFNVNLGAGVTGDGSDNIIVATDGVGTDEIDLSISPVWASKHQFNSGIDFRGDLEDDTTVVWDSSAGYIPLTALQNDSITLSGGDGLKNGSTAQLGGSFSLDIEPTDFAGTFISDNGSDDLTVDISTGLQNDGSDNIEVDEANVDHDSLQNFSSNEHVDHSNVSISSGTGLSGGGNLTSSRTLSLDADTSDLNNAASPNTELAGQLLIWDNTDLQFENSKLTAGSNVSIDNSDASVTINSSDTQLSKEQVQDDAWDVLTGTQSLITVSYDDPNNVVDFTVNDDLSQYDNSTSAFISNITAEPIGDLSNVSITSVSDGDALVYNSGNTTWENVDIATQAELNTHISTSNAHHARPLAGTAIQDNSDIFDFAMTLSDDYSEVIGGPTDINFIDSGAASVNVFSDGDGTATVDIASTDNDTQTDVSDEGSTVVQNTGDINYTDGLTVTDDADGTATAGLNIIKSGSITLSNGLAEIDTGVSSAENATFFLSLGPDTDGAQIDYDVVAQSSGNYKIRVAEDSTSVGNPTVSYDVVRLRKTPGPFISSKAIHRWRVKEGSGQNILDEIGDNDATKSGPTWVSRNNFQADLGLNHDGTDDYIDLTTLDDFGSNLTTDFAISITLQTTTNPSDPIIFGQTSSDGSGGTNSDATTFNLTLVDGSEIQFSLSDQDADNIRSDADSIATDVTNGKPHRILVNKTSNNAAGIEIWVDGNQQTMTEVADQNFDNTINFDLNPLEVMRKKFNGGFVGSNIPGTVDDIIIYGDSLTDSEIQDDYNVQPWS